MTHDPKTLLDKIARREARIAVIGLGYVGLPLCRAFCERGFAVTGFDIDPDKVARLNAGESYLDHVPDAAVQTMLEEHRFQASADFARLGEADAVLICVPTPLTAGREPDLGFVVSTAESVARSLRPGQLVVLESTTYPGTTAERVRPILETAGLACGRDFYLAYSPEREDPGNARYDTAGIPKVVGADDPVSRELAAALYAQVMVEVVPVADSRTAEAVKLTENVFRAVNIALANELKVIYEALGVDVWEVVDAAKTKPFGFMPFYPGPGLGGHCIPIDPFYLAWKARQHGVDAQFVELAGRINRDMPERVVERLAQALQERFAKPLAGARVLVIGAAYKKNVDDTRESPGLVIIELLEARGASADYHDPHVPTLPVTRDHAALAGRPSQPLNAEAVAGYDAVLICTDHDAVDYTLLAQEAALIVDTRNALTTRGLARSNLVKA
jgi:UDP-N-acetyl-D-glucosamine dehydrogenase